MSIALILGITGQDGALLARHLLGLGYEVHGTSRRAGAGGNLDRLSLADRVRLHVLEPQDAAAVARVFQSVRPDEIYHLAAQSSVGLSYHQPRETTESIVTGTLNVLDALRTLDLPARLFNAASAECFGDTGPTGRARSTDAFRPASPYGAAKAAAAEMVRVWRSAFGLWACSGFLFNHESPLRPEGFVTQKIVRGAAAVARGDTDHLTLGDLSVVRDWGWAEEYVVAMHLMLQQPVPRDLVIATGEGHRLEDFVAAAFALHGLDWRAHVQRDASLLRQGEALHSVGDPTEAAEGLGWRAGMMLPDVVKRLTADL